MTEVNNHHNKYIYDLVSDFDLGHMYNPLEIGILSLCSDRNTHDVLPHYYCKPGHISDKTHDIEKGVNFTFSHSGR